MLWHWYIWTLFFTHLLQLCWGACSRALMDRQSQGKKRLQRSILQARVYSYWLVGMQANTRVLGNGNKTRIGNKSEWQDMSCFAFQSCHISSTHSALSFTWRIKLLLHNMSVIHFSSISPKKRPKLTKCFFIYQFFPTSSQCNVSANPLVPAEKIYLSIFL